MPEFSVSEPIRGGHSVSRCPMCGAERAASAAACPECGEVFREAIQTPSNDEVKLRQLVRALAGMHFFVAILLLFVGGLLWISSAEFGFFPETELNRVVAVASFLLGGGNLWVFPGVMRRDEFALKASVWCSSLTVLWSFLSVCLFVLGLLLIAGILQANRILKLIRAQENRTDSPDSPVIATRPFSSK